MQDLWDAPSFEWSYPVSNCRSEARVVETIAPRRPIVPNQVIVPRAPARLAPLPWSAYLTIRKEISPGVWAGGKTLVYSSTLPEVQRLLAQARRTLVLPRPSSDVIFTLAALEVFYKVSDPVHWMFWSDDKKDDTADIVNRIVLSKRDLIVAPVPWHGKVEYLAILGRIHSGGWRCLFEGKDWYPILVPPKPTTPPRLLNLRKRKVPPGAMREPSPLLLPEDEADSIPVKQRGDGNKATSPDVKRRSRGRKAKGKAKAAPETPAPLNASLTPRQGPSVLSSEEALTPLSEVMDLTSEMSPNAPSHTKRRISPPPHYPEPLLSGIDTLPVPIQASLLLGPGVPAGDLHQAPMPMPTHSRTRSTSSESSVDTLVQSSASRSSSVSSAGTAVDAATTSSSRKRKAAAIEEEVSEEIVEENAETHSRSTRSKRAKAAAPSTKANSNKSTSQPTKRKTRKA